jgi:hypothetical protein
MKKLLKKIINILHLNKTLIEIKWRINNKPTPPPHFIKQRIIKNYAKKYSLKVFIETGTYLGETVMSVRNKFSKIFSIELNKPLFERATNLFINNSHIKILQGDSSIVLSSILPTINEPALFWLDGHYSAGITSKGNLNTPILKELESILNHKIKNHVILIDDARCFIGKDDYPTITELELFVKNINQKISFEVNNDIIRILMEKIR